MLYPHEIEKIINYAPEKTSIPFGYKSAKALANFYPDDYNNAAAQNILGELELNKEELEAMVMIASKKDLGILTVDV